MARIRHIKPDFFFDEAVAELKPLARLLYIGLWCLADREGRLEDRPAQIKVRLFPYDTVDIENLLQELEKKPFIERYTVKERAYLWIIHFLKHQRPATSEAQSLLPSPYEKDQTTNKNVARRIKRSGKGKGEGEGKGEGKGILGEPSSGGVLVPVNWGNCTSDLQRFIAHYVKAEMPEMYAKATQDQANGIFKRYGRDASDILKVAGTLDIAKRAFDLAMSHYSDKELAWNLSTVAKNIGEFANMAMQEVSNGRV